MFLHNWRHMGMLKLMFWSLLIFGTFFYFLVLLPQIRSATNPPAQPVGHDAPSHFPLKQDGEYWIYHDFLKASSSDMAGNSTITITTHGTYMDFNQLEWLLVRWEAPISMALYVDGDDFEQTLNSLYFIKYCKLISYNFFRYVSVQLVFHDRHFPRNLRCLSKRRPGRLQCKSPFKLASQNSTNWYQNDAKYPLNLLKNVARLNAKTYYVFHLDPSMLPTLNFVHNFLDFVDTLSINQPQKTVYCVPVFPKIPGFIPKYKSELLRQIRGIWPMLSNMTATDRKFLTSMRHWLTRRGMDGEITQFGITKDATNCPVYVSANAFEPLYEQRYVAFGPRETDLRLQVLTGLNYDFLMLDGTFLIQRNNPEWENLTLRQDVELSVPNQLHLIRQLVHLNGMTLWKSSSFN